MRHLNIPLYSCAEFISTHLRHHYIGYDKIRIKFPYNDKSILSIRAGLDIITCMKHIYQIIAQVIIILHYQDAMQGTVDAGCIHGRQFGSTARYDSLRTLFQRLGRDKFCFMEMSISFRESNPYTCALVFGTLNLDLAFMQLDQFVYQHQSDSATCHFQIDDITTPKIIPEQFFLFT